MRTKGQLKADGYNIRIPCGRYVAYTGPHHTADEYPETCAIADRENAARLVECWNACEEMENPGEAIALAIREMRRYLQVIERLEEYPESWDRVTNGLGIATANGLRNALEKLSPP